MPAPKIRRILLLLSGMWGLGILLQLKMKIFFAELFSFIAESTHVLLFAKHGSTLTHGFGNVIGISFRQKKIQGGN